MSAMTKKQRIEALKAKMTANHITPKMVANRAGYERDYVGKVLRAYFVGDFALNALEVAVDQLVKAEKPVIQKTHTLVSEMSKSVQTTMLVMQFFKTHQVLMARDLSRLMFGIGRDIGIRQSQRILQKMCEGGLLLQARHSDTSMPIEYSLTQAARELMTGGAA